ncbi:hypothetical protein L9F63_003857 [Diploptera punctata]|uniref:Uncharacterized protein n=1 Tax=Diploptera punctata TaxID=6984 RepID=A0AAD8E981_DIPPU|nr:hypothetical protein L9F63_003857 [Diploptera punctata]
MVIEYKGEPDYEISLTADFVGVGSQTFAGTSKPSDTSGLFNTEVPDMSVFNGIYAVVATDYDCFAIQRGCPEGGDISDLIWIQFRDAQPSEDCVNSAKDAMTAAQLDFSALQLDEE